MFNIKQKLAGWAFKKLLRSNGDGWVLTQRGNQYTIDPVERDAETDAYITNDGEYLEDHIGRMKILHGVPFGLRLEQFRQVTDVEDAAVASAADDKVTDGGQLDVNEPITIAQIIERLKVGELFTNNGRIVIVNPFHRLSDQPDIVDLRPTMRLFRHGADPNTPQKAATNAVEAERAKQPRDLTGLAQMGSVFGAFLLGAIVVEYFGGGGGGGGSIDIGLMILPWI